ncbi:hypothetical protein HDU99_000965, partial [Rhizoclosmatium hyalinum]
MGSNEDMLDVFEAGLGAVFDEPLFAIGSPGECYEHSFETHLVSRFPSKEGASSNHNLKLSLPTPKEDSSTPLMAHHIWQAAFVLCREIANGNVAVEDAFVIEFGAGVGLCGLVAAKCGAKQVLATDYPDEGIISTLDVNYKNIFGEECRWVNGKDVWWNVLGHAWGEASSLSKIKSYINPESVTPIVLFMADLLWIPTVHMALLSDIYAILSLPAKSPTTVKSKAHITAGLHTSRETIDAFFKKARDSFGFTVKKIGEIRVGSFGLEDGIVEVGEDVPVERRDLERSDPSERKKWVLYYE